MHTFGIGSGCSVDLVQRVAQAGDGLCNLVRDTSELRSIVIQSLARATEPQYSNVRFNLID